MKFYPIFLLSFLLFSCKPTQELVCKSDYPGRSYLLQVGLNPIDFSREKEVYRIWIDNNSSVSKVITIYKDSAHYFGEYLEYGYTYKNKFGIFPGKQNLYNKNEICPIQGWPEFIQALENNNFKNLPSRPYNPVTDYIIMHHPITRYLVEVKQGDAIKRFTFFSFYPSNVYPDDMVDYKNFEKLILTSFLPLKKALIRSQNNYKASFTYDY